MHNTTNSKGFNLQGYDFKSKKGHKTYKTIKTKKQLQTARDKQAKTVSQFVCFC